MILVRRTWKENILGLMAGRLPAEREKEEGSINWGVSWWAKGEPQRVIDSNIDKGTELFGGRIVSHCKE